jgi:NAD(P)-dependent dehydrogenase (short-subunit alcohol dehydrogenase family)
MTSAGMSGYQCTKSAVNRFAEFVDAEYKATGVRAFAYHPGMPCAVHSPGPSLTQVSMPQAVS